MLSVILFLFTISTQKHYSTTKSTDVTDPIKTRIQVLKWEIEKEMNENKKIVVGRSNPLLSDQYSDMYEYVDIANQPITPIMDFDKRKLQGKFKMPEIKSRPTEKYIPSDSNDSNDEKAKRLRSKKRIYKYDTKLHRPKDIFYRKMFSDDQERNKPQKWTHCLELLTPFLNGVKEEVTFKQITAKDGTVMRLAQLLSMNTTSMSKDDIRSILYQISNLQLRMFQWDVDAIKTVFNIIMNGRQHDFKGLKHGVKAIFAKWQLDTSDITSFVKQSRIFRPPCIAVSPHEGSTMSSKTDRFTKPTQKCEDSDDNDCTA